MASEEDDNAPAPSDAQAPVAPGEAVVTAEMTSTPPPWLLRAFLLAAATVAGLFAGFWALTRLQGLLTIVLVSLFLAFAIEPAVNWLARRGMKRGLATAVVFLVLISVVVAFFWTLGSLLIDQITTLVNNAPEYADQGIDWVNRTFHTHISGTDLEKYTSNWSKYLEGAAGNAWDISTKAVSVVFQSLGVLLFTYYFAADGPRFRNAVCSLLPPRKQLHVLRAWDIAVQKTGGYIYSRGLLALASTLAHYVALRVLDVPSAFALALWVGVVSQFIPTVGTYLAGALPVIVALVHGPSDALWILGFIVLYQQFENYVLQPRITATTLDMHPAVAFGAVLAGAALLGATGALLAIPVTATVQAFAGAYVRRYEVQTDVDLDAPLPPPPPKPHRKWARQLTIRFTGTDRSKGA
ncbi:AI-2E family transporter [Nocardia brasiliensis]|uniref:AI-2E family transporter n=1 Tax=Nocardia brasiliensis TaxID=37326 RepID=UPI00189362CD|nr:AI-2E family transporter [Nocardia brasiliensis]MBF6545911.1 AI-2E family transporter [Nocardia brasiliensis]